MDDKPLSSNDEPEVKAAESNEEDPEDSEHNEEDQKDSEKIEEDQENSEQNEEDQEDSEQNEEDQEDSEQNEIAIEAAEEDELVSSADPYTKHFEYELPEGFPKDKLKYKTKVCDFPEIGNAVYAKPEAFPSEEPIAACWDISEFHLKKNLLTSLQKSPKEPSPFQLSFLNLISNYYDVTYMQRTPTRGKAMRQMYTLHILNHILKSRAKIIHHNSKLSKNPDEEYRDQGFARPTTLVLVPFRHDCYCIIQLLVTLLPECVIMNKKRFDQEFGPPPKRQRKKKKPQDFEDTFEGNIDEDFKIGLCIKNKSIKLYSEFYSSDLIIASPLGLRPVIGAQGDKERDYDFLSSIEILVLDRVDVLYMQNLGHLLHVFQHLNLLPKEAHGCNFFRVRMYALDEMAKFYRQTIFLSAVEHHWFANAFLHNYCFNYKGYLRSITTIKSRGIAQIFDTVKVCFRFFDITNRKEEFEDRFNFFVTKVLPDFKEPEMAQTLLYIPSYFDYVRLRNYFRANELSAVMVCEYTDSGKVAEARNNFFKGRRHFMLYTERAHFYKRYNIKGLQHIIFYQPPTYPIFFREMNFAFLNSNPRRKYEEKTCTILASEMDLLQLKYILGMNEAKKMLSSEKKVFVKYIER